MAELVLYRGRVPLRKAWIPPGYDYSWLAEPGDPLQEVTMVTLTLGADRWALDEARAHIEADHTALRQVWELHRPYATGNRALPTSCVECLKDWPCPTIVAVTGDG